MSNLPPGCSSQSIDKHFEGDFQYLLSEREKEYLDMEEIMEEVNEMMVEQPQHETNSTQQTTSISPS